MEISQAFLRRPPWAYPLWLFTQYNILETKTSYCFIFPLHIDLLFKYMYLCFIIEYNCIPNFEKVFLFVCFKSHIQNKKTKPFVRFFSEFSSRLISGF